MHKAVSKMDLQRYASLVSGIELVEETSFKDLADFVLICYCRCLIICGVLGPVCKGAQKGFKGIVIHSIAPFLLLAIVQHIVELVVNDTHLFFVQPGCIVQIADSRALSKGLDTCDDLQLMRLAQFTYLVARYTAKFTISYQ